jgi:hypothetical protein
LTSFDNKIAESNIKYLKKKLRSCFMTHAITITTLNIEDKHSFHREENVEEVESSSHPEQMPSKTVLYPLESPFEVLESKDGIPLPISKFLMEKSAL